MEYLVNFFTPGDKYLGKTIFYDVDTKNFRLYADTENEMVVNIEDPQIYPKILKCWIISDLQVMGKCYDPVTSNFHFEGLNRLAEKFISIDKPRLYASENGLYINSNSVNYVDFYTYLTIGMKYFSN